MRSCLHSGQAGVREALTSAVHAATPRLVARHPPATAACLLALGLTREQLHSILQRLDSEPRAKFELLRAVLALADRLAQVCEEGDLMYITKGSGCYAVHLCRAH